MKVIFSIKISRKLKLVNLSGLDKLGQSGGQWRNQSFWYKKPDT